MGKILNSIFALILSANTYTIAYTESNVDKKKNTSVISSEIQENIALEKLSPVKGTVTKTTSTAWWTYPTDIKETTRDGNNLLVLVNKEYKLPSTYTPSDLVSICPTVSNLRCVNNVDFLIRNIVVEDLQSLANSAKEDGIDLSVRSAFRSYNTQTITYNHWLSVNGGNVAATDKISARAGHSQHQLGTTIDFSTSEISDGLGGTFGGTKASQWLANNAYKYGFVISYPQGYESVTGYNYESWHYRYIGKEHAQDMVNSGMILELYLRSKN
jgi:D-alanyl-D-alanine carboxypeptidase